MHKREVYLDLVERACRQEKSHPKRQSAVNSQRCVGRVLRRGFGRRESGNRVRWEEAKISPPS